MTDYKSIDDWIERNPNHIGAIPIEVCRQIWGAKEALAQPEQEPVACKSLCVECTKRGDWACAKTVPPQPEQEPVAWRVRWPKVGGGHAWVMNDEPLMAEHGFVNEPLYTTPPPQVLAPRTDATQRKPLTNEVAMLAAQHMFLEWNRRRPERYVRVSYECGVFQKAIEFYNEAAQGIKE